MLKRIICRIFKHKPSKHDADKYFPDFRCTRCLGWALHKNPRGPAHYAILALFFFAVAAHAQDLPENPKPKWLDKQTIAELSAVGASFALDGLSTQAKFGWPAQFRRFNGAEDNPILRADKSRAVTIAYFAGTFSAYVGGSYLLRRHKRIQFFTALAVSGMEAYAVRSNYKNSSIGRSQWHLCMSTPGAVACPR